MECHGIFRKLSLVCPCIHYHASGLSGLQILAIDAHFSITLVVHKFCTSAIPRSARSIKYTVMLQPHWHCKHTCQSYQERNLSRYGYPIPICGIIVVWMWSIVIACSSKLFPPICTVYNISLFEASLVSHPILIRGIVWLLTCITHIRAHHSTLQRAMWHVTSKFGNGLRVSVSAIVPLARSSPFFCSPTRHNFKNESQFLHTILEHNKVCTGPLYHRRAWGINAVSMHHVLGCIYVVFVVL